MSNKPRSIDELTRAARFRFDACPEFFALVMGTQDLFQQAQIYEAEDDLESAYIMLCRSYRMSLEEIPKHLDFATSGQAVADRLVSISARALRNMLRLRPLLEANHRAWMESRSLKHSRCVSNSPLGIGDKGRSQYALRSSTEHATRDGSQKISSDTKSQRVLPRPTPSSIAGTPYIPIVQNGESTRPSYVRTISSPSLNHQRNESNPTAPASRLGSMPPVSSSKMTDIPYGPPFNTQRGQAQTMLNRHPVPIPPLQAGYQEHSRRPATLFPITSRHSPLARASSHVALPAKPVRVSIPISTSNESSRGPSFSRSGTSSSIQPSSSSASETSSGHTTEDPDESRDESRLRRLLLPPNLIGMFAAVAAPNTEKNIETCGFIMGHLKENKLIASLLVIPKQTGNSDTCTTMNEEEIWNVTDREGVIFLGWIHTHPRHDCFLSSKDLHTQAGYQQLLPEAIAIVIAPTSNPSIGIFRLTDPPGLSIISKCTKGNEFHPHYEAGPLYVDAYDNDNDDGDGEGHVVMMKGDKAKTRLIDLR